MPPALLYNKVLTVFIIQDDDRRNCDILFSIEEVLHNIKKEIIIRLTDEVDQFFLFQLKITEEDFQVLKAQQGLLIDFKAFPQKVIEMLEECRERNSREAGKFNLVFKMSGCGGFSNMGQLSIMETNEFKHLTHLQLEFHPGTDNDIKNYILGNLKNTKYKLDQMTAAYNKVEYELKQCKESLAARTNELSQLRESSENKIREMECFYEKKQTDIQLKCKEEIRDVDEKCSGSMKKLEQRVEELTENTQSLKEIKRKQELQIADLKANISSMDDEKKTLQSEKMILKKSMAALESQLSSQSHQFGDITASLTRVESDLRVKEDLLRKEEEQLQAERLARKAIENEHENNKKKIKMLIEKLKREHDKNCELKIEIEHLNAKMKHRTDVSIKQEEFITQKSKENDDLIKRIKTLETELCQKSEQVTIIRTEREYLRGELEKSRTMLKENEEVLKWISKQPQDNAMQTRDQIKFLQGIPCAELPYSDSINNANNNNSKPIMCEDFIDQKYLRSSLADTLVEPLQANKQASPSIHNSAVQRCSPSVINPSISRCGPGSRNSVQYTSTPVTKPSQVASALPPAYIPSRRSVPTSNSKSATIRDPSSKTTTSSLVSAYFPSTHQNKS